MYMLVLVDVCCCVTLVHHGLIIAEVLKYKDNRVLISAAEIDTNNQTACEPTNQQQNNWTPFFVVETQR